MKKAIFLLPAVLLLSACTLIDSPVGSDPHPYRPAAYPDPGQRPQRKAPRRKTSMPEAVESSMKHDPSLEPDKDIQPDPYAKPARDVPVYPMNTDSVRGTSELYRDMNARKPAPDYLQTRPREPSPYREVNRTGSNPMNTDDRTTNRRVYRR
ncbi:hypothetical protein LJC19_07925 [Oxalobacter sp. OttesenSCG-928-P03]|nr:hypothetical protein [Oxalobacter sp. OttesenSCG-928-P03]